MFQDNPTFALVNFAIAACLFHMWLGDFRFWRANGAPRNGAFAGATSVSPKFGVFAALAAAALLAVHIAVETALGVEQKQTSVSAWALFSWIGAAWTEEFVFRGYLVVQNRGRAALVASIIVFSLVFALGHPFMWDYSVPEGASVFGGQWKFDFSAQPINATLSIFTCSLLFYALRFVPANKNRSIIPCACAHLTYNLGVFAAKAVQGFVG